ncbi:MAG: hypothetical protein NTY35_00620 [Planctomycetota bacterium]|nr:hypothetical protein [Planctomycetota bacterium]
MSREQTTDADAPSMDSTVVAPAFAVEGARPDGAGTPTPRSTRRPWRHLGARLVYWTPVLASLALFAQVAFLGLRPALSEARRLAVASDVLEARWSRDRGLYDAYELQLRVRQDPIFVERQRRLRCALPARASSGA